MSRPDFPLVIGHRGDSANAPENTLAAFDLALSKGADGVEFDVRLTRDGIPVVIHDRDLRRTAGVKTAVSNLSALELQNIPADVEFRRKHPTASVSGPVYVPTLAETLDRQDAGDEVIYVELKIDNEPPEPLVMAVCDVIRESSAADRIIVKSFCLDAIPLVRQRLPGIRTAALFGDQAGHFLKPKGRLVAEAVSIGTDSLSVHHRLATPRLADLAAAAGMPLAVWTVDDPRWLGRANALGIYALITNDPGRMLDALGRGTSFTAVD